MRETRDLSMRVLVLLLAVGGLLLQAGCATTGFGARHPAFTADRVLGLQTGMTTDQVISLFGRPDRTRVMTCGTKTDSPWQCLMWEYDMGQHPQGRYRHSNNINRFTFYAELSPPRLNNWTIDLMYNSPSQ